MKANIQLTKVSLAHEDAGLKVGGNYEATIANLENQDVKMAKFPIKGINHIAWILLNPNEAQKEGLTYAKIL